MPLAAEHQVQRAADLAEQVARFALGQRHGFGQHQPRVVAPAIALAQLQQVTHGQQAGGAFGQLGVQPLAALRQGGVEVIEAGGARLAEAR